MQLQIQTLHKDREAAERNLRMEKQAHIKTEKRLNDVKRQLLAMAEIESRVTALKVHVQQLEEDNKALKRNEIFKTKEIEKLQSRAEKAENLASDATATNR